GRKPSHRQQKREQEHPHFDPSAGRIRIAFPPPGAIFTCSTPLAFTRFSSCVVCFGFSPASAASDQISATNSPRPNNSSGKSTSRDCHPVTEPTTHSPPRLRATEIYSPGRPLSTRVSSQTTGAAFTYSNSFCPLYASG